MVKKKGTGAQCPTCQTGHSVLSQSCLVTGVRMSQNFSLTYVCVEFGKNITHRLALQEYFFAQEQLLQGPNTHLYLNANDEERTTEALVLLFKHERLINWNNKVFVYLWRERGERERRLTLDFFCSPVICRTESVVSVFLQRDIFCCGPVSPMPYLYRPVLFFCILDIKHNFNLQKFDVSCSGIR